MHPRRWQVRLGSTSSGEPVAIPASQLNVLITGTPQRGKSYITGLIAERLIGLGYCVVVMDPEGDHLGLGTLPGGAGDGQIAGLLAAAGRLPPERRFYFRRSWDAATGATAASIEELEHELRTCEDEVIAHHCRFADLSRWIAGVLGDPPLAAAVAEIEKAVRAGTTSIAEARADLTGVIHGRYQG